MSCSTDFTACSRMHMSAVDYSIRHLSHGVFAVSGLRDMAQLHFSTSRGTNFYLTLNIGREIMLRELISKVFRAVKASRFGHHEFLIAWFGQIRIETGF